MVFCVEYFVECEMQFYAVCIWGGGLNDRGVARQEGEFGNITAVEVLLVRLSFNL